MNKIPISRKKEGRTFRSAINRKWEFEYGSKNSKDELAYSPPYPACILFYGGLAFEIFRYDNFMNLDIPISGRKFCSRDRDSTKIKEKLLNDLFPNLQFDD